MKPLIGFLILMFLNSCSNDKEEQISPLLGRYDLLEYKSNIALDLNGDGIKSADIYMELKAFYFDINQPFFGYDAEISKEHKYSLYCKLPVPTSYGPISSISKFGTTSSAYWLYFEDDFSVVSNFELIPDPVISPFQLEQINFSNNMLTLEINQSYYCYTDHQHKLVKTIAKFRKQ